jgi:glycosyltransferase involved in cell wall biosynthesis
VEVVLDFSHLRYPAAAGGWEYARGLLAGLERVDLEGIKVRCPIRAGLPPLDVPDSIGITTLHSRGYASRLESAYFVRRARPDVVHWLGNYRLPGSGKTPSLVLVNDFGKAMSLSLGYPLSPLGRLAGAMIDWQLSKATQIIVYADSVADQVHQRRPQASVTVNPPGPGHVVLCAAASPNSPVSDLGDRPFILIVGGNAQHKRFKMLTEAFSQSSLPEAGYLLVHAGLGLEGSDASVRTLGRVDEASLSWLLERASALAMPSSYEGFGMPVLEAATFGVPTLVSPNVPAAASASELSEVTVIGDGDWVDALSSLQRSPRVHARTLDERSEIFTRLWAKHASVVTRAWRRIGGGRGAYAPSN